jgi:hypothetical protein
MPGIIPSADQASVFENFAFEPGEISELHSYVRHKSSFALAESVSAGCFSHVGKEKQMKSVNRSADVFS